MGQHKVSHPPTFDHCEFPSLEKSHDFVLGSPFNRVAVRPLAHAPILLSQAIFGVKELHIINIIHVHL